MVNPFPRIPAPGQRFRLQAQATNLVLFSQPVSDPDSDGAVGHGAENPLNRNQIFTLFYGTGAREGKYCIKSWPNGRVLYSRNAPPPLVGNIDGDGFFAHNWFEFVDNDQEWFRIYCRNTDTVLYSRGEEEPTFGNAQAADSHDNQRWRFVLVN